MAKLTTKAEVCGAVAKSLRDFGYPDVTGKMVEEILAAWLTGKRDSDLPHGIIGMFAESQFQQVEDNRPGLLASLK